MLLNNQLTQEIHAAWTDDQMHPHRGRTEKPIPSEQDFAVLLDIMFQASLLREEGKHVLTSVTWVSRNDFEAHEIGRMRQSKLALEFDAPIDFEAHNLAKLNGIVNGKTGSILACRTESSAYIWGICYFMGRTGPIGDIPASSMEARHFRPDYPTVTITGVGSMEITRSDSVIGWMEGGKFLRAQATVFTSFMLGQYLYRLIGIDVDLTSRKFKSDDDADASKLFFNCVDFIIEVLAQRRTGATVIFVPPNLKERALEETDTAWKIHGSLEIDLLQRARLKLEKMVHESKNISGALFRLEVDQALRHRLRSLVDLAGIDGAVLLTPSFEVIGFGMKLKSPKWEWDVQHGPLIQSVEKQQLDFSRLGTRHNSALNFVGSIEGAVAFVASSDGPIRALVRATEEKVWYWPDCRVSMFAK